MEKQARAIFFSSLALALTAAPARPQAGGKAPWASSDLLIRSWRQHQRMARSSPFGGLRWRALGPSFQGGRIETVRGVPGRPGTIWAGAGSGGLWRSRDDGLHWEDALHGQATTSVGDVAVAPSNPDIIWAGSGENLRARGFAFAGIGVLRSQDGGRTWRDAGLHDSHHIGRIAVHPRKPEVAWVAALGHFWSPSAERGVFRTLDGGRTWERTLFVDENTGAFDLAIDPSDPSVLYAATWQIPRGKGSAVHKSRDGGATWRRLGGGLPGGAQIGRIDIDVAPSNPRVVYALVHSSAGRAAKGKAKKGAAVGTRLYRSADGGRTWERRHRTPLAGFTWAMGDVRVSPADENEIWLLGVRLLHSRDGGRSLRWIGGEIFHLQPSRARTLHLDQHELWIDPADPAHLILGNDGGIYISRDRGASWEHRNNLPIAEFYDIAADDAEPYNLYGGTQDDASVYGPARELRGGFDAGWRYVWLDPWSGGDGFVTTPDPSAPGTVYYESQNGHLLRKNLRTGRSRLIAPRARRGEPELRRNWYTPYLISPHNPFILYYGAQRLLRSLDRGEHWFAAGPDLTAVADPKRKSRALSALAESPLRAGWIWAGTERGIVQLSRDGGASWSDVSAGLPRKHVKRIVASAHALQRVYVVQSGIDQDDFQPYVHASEDGGKSWRSLAANLPLECTNALAEDPTDERLLFLGTDKGVYVSCDRGASWAILGEHLPPASVQDLELQPRAAELIAGTHGRGAFAIGIAPLREFLVREVAAEGAHLFPIAPARRPDSRDRPGDIERASGRAAILTWWLKEPAGVEIAITDSKGHELWRHRADGRAGMNQVRWDLAIARNPEKGCYFIPGYRYAQPGTYGVTLSTGGAKLTAELEILRPSS